MSCYAIVELPLNVSFPVHFENTVIEIAYQVYANRLVFCLEVGLGFLSKTELP